MPLSDSKMPRDQNGDAMQMLAVDQATAGKITVAGVSASVALDASIGRDDVVRIACDTDCYIVWGFGSADTADATDVLFIAGVEYFKVPDGATHLSAIQVSAGGVLDIVKMV